MPASSFRGVRGTRAGRPFRIEGVLFDFDGTLTRPGALDFVAIKKQMGCPAGEPLLEFIEKIADAGEQRRARETLDRFEMAAAAQARPNPGAEALVGRLRARGLKIGILTRNTRAAVDASLANFREIDAGLFDAILSRDDAASPKPSGEGVLLAAERMGVDPAHLLVVGDFIFDVQAGRAAGALTAFLENGRGPAGAGEEGDFTVSDLSALRPLIRLGAPLPPGKFPNALLREFLDDFEFQDPSLIINPGIGEDIAAVDVGDEEVLILKSDPITFVTDAVGHYAVLINANDIATSGAVPRWLLATLLFPPGMSASEIFAVMYDVKDVCREWGITLCGGHTEITDAVTRPVVSGTLAGTVGRKDLIDKAAMRPGDRVLLTKGVAVEGTTIIARELGDRLSELGVTEGEIETCKGFLADIGVLTEARIAAACEGTSAMHDVTEGGLATALGELAIAGGHRIRIRMEAIPIFPETEKIGRLMGFDPLGLIGSGSLLICCRPDHCDGLLHRIRDAGIPVTIIGEVAEAGEGIEATRDGAPAEWPRFEVDELTRLF